MNALPANIPTAYRLACETYLKSLTFIFTRTAGPEGVSAPGLASVKLTPLLEAAAVIEVCHSSKSAFQSSPVAMAVGPVTSKTSVFAAAGATLAVPVDGASRDTVAAQPVRRAAVVRTMTAAMRMWFFAWGVWSSGLTQPNVRAKRATAAGRLARAGENVPRIARRGLVACRWHSARARRWAYPGERLGVWAADALARR